MTLSSLDSYPGVKLTWQERRRDVLIHCLSPVVFKLFQISAGFWKKIWSWQTCFICISSITFRSHRSRSLGTLKTQWKYFLDSKMCKKKRTSLLMISAQVRSLCLTEHIHLKLGDKLTYFTWMKYLTQSQT